MSPLLSICVEHDCRRLTATRPRCPQCKRSYEARRNARPERAAHRTPWHYRIARFVKAKDGRCLECGATEGLTVDYIVPLSRGGEQSVENARTLCRSCNSCKGARVA